MSVSPYMQAVLADGPVFYMPLDDITANSSIQELISGNLRGVTFSSPVPTAATGAQSGFVFSGSEYVTIPADMYETSVDEMLSALAGFDAATPVPSSFSVECWLSKDAAGSDETGVSLFINSGSPGGFYFGLDSSENVTFSFYENVSGTPTLRTITSTSSVSTGSLHYCVAVYDIDDSELRLYVDGSSAATPVATSSGGLYVPSTLPSGSLFDIGRRALASPDRYLTGAVDDVAIYDYELGVSDISAHYARSRDFAYPIFDLQTDTTSGASISYDLTIGTLWWNGSYYYRRSVDLQAPPEGWELDHPIYVYLPRSYIQQNKIKETLEGVEIVKHNDTSSNDWTVLAKDVSLTEDYVLVRFALDEALIASESVTKKYYVYYGNKLLVNVPPSAGTYIHTDWPISLDSSSGSISYTNPGVDWVNGYSSVTGAVATVYFYGGSIRVLGPNGFDYGIAEFRVDDDAWEKVDMFDNSDSSGNVLFLSTGLDSSVHRLRIRCSGQKNPSSGSTSVGFSSIEISRYNDVTLANEETYPDLPKGSIASTGGTPI